MTLPPRRWLLSVHPWLFAAWLPLFVGARNLDEDVAASSIGLWIAGYCAGALGLWLIARLLTRDAVRASLLVTISILAFYAYPFVDDWASGPGARAIAARSALGVGWLAACALVVRRRQPPEPLSLGLTYAGLILVGMAALPIGKLWVGGSEASERSPSPLRLAMPARPPDIYFIILDGYGRHDVLREYFGFDNSGFLEELEGLGFFVARESSSNYNQTALSIPASLNMDYLDELVPGLEVFPRRVLRTRLRELVHDALVPRVLEQAGYRVELITGAWAPSSRCAAATRVHECRGLSDFGTSMVERTALRIWSDRLVRSGRREQILCQYEVLGEIAGRPGPKLVLAHIVSPHGPWLFDADGGSVVGGGSLLLGAESKDRVRYVQQVAFNNSRVLRAVRSILSRSERQPVIVIQGDHGPSYAFNQAPKRRLRRRLAKLDRAEGEEALRQPWAHPYWLERYGILNAVLLPPPPFGESGPEPYPSISPVNTFRLVLSRYLGADLPLLADRSLFATHHDPGRHWDLTSLLREAEVVAPRPRRHSERQSSR